MSVIASFHQEIIGSFSSALTVCTFVAALTSSLLNANAAVSGKNTLSSSSNANAPVEARGLGQLMPRASRRLGVKAPLWSRDSLEGSARHLTDRLDNSSNARGVANHSDGISAASDREPLGVLASNSASSRNVNARQADKQLTNIEVHMDSKNAAGKANAKARKQNTFQRLFGNSDVEASAKTKHSATITKS